ncbi:B-cell receptor CD22-like isoform X2 [Channa argus]|uniref:B-cell receptor CD22-like isoform X2 n=1 Tax=Channa argus TaxID=215402 RepID=UPI0035216537
MGLTTAASGFVILLLAVPVLQNQNGWWVTYTSTNICALKGSTVTINCTYTHPNTATTIPLIKVEKTLWFVKGSNNIYVDLRTDPDYLGRVDYHCEDRKCSLTIRDLRLSDSAEYKFRFITNLDSGKYTGQPGVTLSVTDLQVQVRGRVVNQFSNSVELKCQSSCPLPDHPTYIWYKNEQRELQHSNTDKFHTTVSTNSYSCAVTGHENYRSPPVVVTDLWAVTYTSTQICAFRRSTVNISCTYRYPSRIDSTQTEVKRKFWFPKLEGDKYMDLKTDSDYRDRVQYHCKENDCTMRITDLRQSDSAVYQFRFITNHKEGKYTGQPGVTLSVTDPQLQVHVRRSAVNQFSTWIELTCSSSCQLPERPKYIWYNNEQEVGRKEGEQYYHLDTFNPADNYACAIEGYEEFRSPSVYAPKLRSVSVSPSGEIKEHSSVTLTCNSDANPSANYTWFRKDGNPDLQLHNKQLVFSSIRSSDSGQYYCAADNDLGRTTKYEYISIDVKYPPKAPSVSVSPSAEIVEGSSVNLNCSSDANPAANYIWYKDNKQVHQGPDGFLHFPSISPENKGTYFCMSENQYGQFNSTHLVIVVQYAPKLPSVSVSPSAEIVEGSSVTLTCSSDANPAANYTWYNGSQVLLHGAEGLLHFTSIRSADTGSYYCKSTNRHGQINSTSLLIDVKYAPKLPSVSVSPSAEIVEGSSVTLTCSSDANPAANYTWYKENEDSPKASGQNFTITNIRPEHSGNYSCEAQNKVGRYTNTLQLTVVAVFPKARDLAVIGTIITIVVAAIVLCVYLLRRKKRTSKRSSEPGERPANNEQVHPSQPEEQDDVDYASVHFPKTLTEPIYYNINRVTSQRHKDREDECVEYSTVKFHSTGPSQETGEDSSTLYSTINKIY